MYHNIKGFSVCIGIIGDIGRAADGNARHNEEHTVAVRGAANKTVRHGRREWVLHLKRRCGLEPACVHGWKAGVKTHD
jgi:hypothetical protein